MKQYVKKFLLIFGSTAVICLLLLGVMFGGAVLGFWGNLEGIDVEALTMRQNSTIVYLDPDTGQEKELQKLSSKENRDWASIDEIPEDLKHAFVAIEDERFYEHKGYDLMRTTKATLTWVGRKLTGKSGAAALGGSTITQQLIKNLTGEDEQTPARKIQEISRAVALEKELDKEQILELYLNCIYLSQGCNGVQTASSLYFDKDVSELSLAECASLAGITQYPSLYDPFVNPEKNKERQELVLGKMLELDYISQEQYTTAVSTPLKFADPNHQSANANTGTTSYFVDQVIRDVLRDLQKEGYSESLANKILYSGGVKVYTTYVPEVQKAVEEYYENAKNFPDSKAQSAMAIVDVRTGKVAGIAGGIGEKSGSLTLNRASMSPRQPGSSIKPLSVYAPALDRGLITAGSVYDDAKKSYNGWTPRNSDYQYRGKVDIRRAIRTSLNTIPVEIMSQMGAQTSFDYLRDKMGITSLVEARQTDSGIITDIGYSQLALGGLTDGVTVLEMAAAFATFANEGIYNTPYIYTEVKDKDGNVILTAERDSWEAMKSSTAFIMSRMLNEVVTSGTGSGAGLSNGIFTAGKTGTTTENKDRWFVGFTPYYAAAVWYGYDIPEEITISSNPCVAVFRSVMSQAHKNLTEKRTIEKPSDVIQVSYCTYSGKRAGESCPSDYYYFSKDNIPAYCGSAHEGLVKVEDEEDEEEDDETKTSGTGSTGSTGTSSGTTSNSGSSTGTSTSRPSGSTSSGSGASSSSGTAGNTLQE
ncbi:MAG: PBP1A family penicillin-binding protein [Clostridia bacterium]|nr:PBP1A family penicillin-binding protein [Clostridia bacterium]